MHTEKAGAHLKSTKDEKAGIDCGKGGWREGVQRGKLRTTVITNNKK